MVPMNSMEPEDILMRNQELTLAVARLTAERDNAADEIEDLMFRLEGTIGELDNALSRERTLLSEQEDCRIGADNLKAEIERLTAERDEARREVCECKCSPPKTPFFGAPQELAEVNGWDCYGEAG